MIIIISIIAAVVALASGNEFLCDIPTAGCSNGMFDQVTCSCECIPPFCPDALGNCIVSGTCEDPWKNCERGKNCPWWPNPLKAESCTTGPTIPEGTWDLFDSEEICCKSSFPYSEYCGKMPESASPTKYPTIAFLEDNDEEIVSIQFSVANMSDNIPLNSIKSEMEIVLRRVILRVAEKIDGMKVTKVEAAEVSHNLRRHLRKRILAEMTFYFHVYIVRDDDKQFGPYIINEIRDSYADMLAEIQSFSDTKYLRGDLGLNFCTLYDGEYDLCAVEEIITDAPSPVVPQISAPLQLETDDVGLAGWAIALISVSFLFLFCCGGYAIAVVCFDVPTFCSICFREAEDKEDIQKNVSIDKRLGPSESASSRLAIMDSKSQSPRRLVTLSQCATFSRSRNSMRPTQGNEIPQDFIHSGAQVVFCSNPQYPSFDDTFTINTYSTKFRKTRDPTMFISGQGGKPDPSAATFSQGYAPESAQPSLKPKRDPTMYIDGKAFAIDRTRKQRRDPTLNDGREQCSIITDVHSRYPTSSMRYELEAIEDDVEYARSYLESKPLHNMSTYRCDEPPSLFGSMNYRTNDQCSAIIESMKSKSSPTHLRDGGIRTSEFTSPNSKSACSNHPHRSRASRNETLMSGVYSA